MPEKRVPMRLHMRADSSISPDTCDAEVRLSIVFFCSQSEVRPIEVLDDVLRWTEATDIEHELVITVDGDRGQVFQQFRQRVSGRERVKLAILNSRQGQLATIRTGISLSSGRHVVMFPAYPQVRPESIPRILEALEKGADYVVGVRKKRRDSIFNRIAARSFNRLVYDATGIRFRDIACGVQGLSRYAFRLIPDYGDNQVFLPILAAREGLKVEEIPVIQNPEEPRLRVFSPATYLRRALSLASLAFLVRFTQKPLRPFGALGAILFLTGLILSLILVWQRLFLNHPLAERPMLLLALLLLTAGIQVIILGLLGELLVYLHSRDQATYHVDERTEQRKGDSEP